MPPKPNLRNVQNEIDKLEKVIQTNPTYLHHLNNLKNLKKQLLANLKSANEDPFTPIPKQPVWFDTTDAIDATFEEVNKIDKEETINQGFIANIKRIFGDSTQN